MTNTHILVQEFDYLEPASLEEAISLLGEHGEPRAASWPAAPICWSR